MLLNRWVKCTFCPLPACSRISFNLREFKLSLPLYYDLMIILRSWGKLMRWTLLWLIKFPLSITMSFQTRMTVYLVWIKGKVNFLREMPRRWMTLGLNLLYLLLKHLSLFPFLSFGTLLLAWHLSSHYLTVPNRLHELTKILLEFIVLSSFGFQFMLWFIKGTIFDLSSHIINSLS